MSTFGDDLIQALNEARSSLNSSICFRRLPRRHMLVGPP